MTEDKQAFFTNTALAFESLSAERWEDAANHFGRAAQNTEDLQIIFSAMLNRAKCMSKVATGSEIDFAKVCDAFLDAHRLRPSRAEAIRHLILWCEQQPGRAGFADSLWHALPLDTDGKIIPTTDTLDVEAWCYVDRGDELTQQLCKWCGRSISGDCQEWNRKTPDERAKIARDRHR